MNIRTISQWCLLAAFVTAGSVAHATAQATPDAIVRSLYAVHDRKTDPFFQTHSRTRLDLSFTKDLGDLIWKDVKESKGEVGRLDFDPLYNAQDVHIKRLKIGKPVYGEGNLDLADVPVTFSNMGHAETVMFRVLRNKRRVWRIDDILYTREENARSSLREILSSN